MNISRDEIFLSDIDRFLREENKPTKTRNKILESMDKDLDRSEVVAKKPERLQMMKRDANILRSKLLNNPDYSGLIQGVELSNDKVTGSMMILLGPSLRGGPKRIEDVFVFIVYLKPLLLETYIQVHRDAPKELDKKKLITYLLNLLGYTKIAKFKSDELCELNFNEL